MARTKKSAQKKAAGASLARRQPPPRSEKLLKRSERAAETADMRRQTALFPSIYASDHTLLKKARFGAVASHVRGDMPAREATEVLPPAEVREPTQIPIFDIFVMMGLVPPFSDFLLEILQAYGLRLLHLTPGAILDLVVFAHACEVIVGLMPSVALFRHFFSPRVGKEGWLAGGVMPWQS